MLFPHLFQLHLSHDTVAYLSSLTSPLQPSLPSVIFCSLSHCLIFLSHLVIIPLAFALSFAFFWSSSGTLTSQSSCNDVIPFYFYFFLCVWYTTLTFLPVKRHNTVSQVLTIKVKYSKWQSSVFVPLNPTTRRYSKIFLYIRNRVDNVHTATQQQSYLRPQIQNVISAPLSSHQQGAHVSSCLSVYTSPPRPHYLWLSRD